MRARVRFSAYYDANGIKYLKEPLEGIFQRWGDEIRYEDEKTFQLTVAIILGDDGAVYTAPPNRVKSI